MFEKIQILQNMIKTQKKKYSEDALVDETSEDDEIIKEADDSFNHMVGCEVAVSVPDNELPTQDQNFQFWCGNWPSPSD